MKPSIEWKKDRVVMIDQRELPEREVYLECRDENEVAEAIEKMAIRGAPAIGVAAAYGVALGLARIQQPENLDDEVERILGRLEKTRPTARNLFWAMERMNAAFRKYRTLGLAELKKRMISEALRIEEEDIATNRRIGFWGKSLIEDGQSVLTYCNTGSLATAGYGTALGIIRAAIEEGKKIETYACETRPLLQGARLTCWELVREKIPVTLVTDNAAGHLMRKGRISLVIVGADRIARNGDTANKIGTYSLAVLARENRLPFYVAAPLSTVDFSLADGSAVCIEERSPQEVRELAGRPLSPAGVKVQNPAFDLTPARSISAFITEEGIIGPPFGKNLKRLQKRKKGNPENRDECPGY